MHEYVLVKDNRFDKEPAHWKHKWKRLWAVYCGILSIAVVVVLCNVAAGDFLHGSPVIEVQTSRRDHSAFGTTAKIMQGRTDQFTHLAAQKPAINMAGLQHMARAMPRPPTARAWQFRRLEAALPWLQPVSTRQLVQRAQVSQSWQPQIASQSVKPQLRPTDDAGSALQTPAANKQNKDLLNEEKATQSLTKLHDEGSPAPGTPGASPAQTVRALYDSFNRRDAKASGALLADDCVYEDLLLGPATVCRGRRAFEAALRWHPAFVGSTLASVLPEEYAKRLPKIMLIVDSVAEDSERGTVGVEWHVSIEQWKAGWETDSGVTRTPFPLGRGLSHANVNLSTGKIERVVDIAEAPWRVVGLLVSPLIAAAASLQTEIFRAATLIAARRRLRGENNNA